MSRDESNSRRRYSVALVGVVLYVVLDAVAQLLPPHYSPLSQAESDLAVGPYGFIMTLNFLNRGLLSLEFLLALLASARLAGLPASRMRGGLLLFGLWSIGALLLAFFPTDVPSTPVSWHGAVHLVLALLAFVGGGLGTLALSLDLRGSPYLDGARRIALPLAVLCVLLLLAEVLAPFSAPRFAAHYGGLLERLFLGSVLLWVAGVSVYMLRHPPATGEAKSGPTPKS